MRASLPGADVGVDCTASGRDQAQRIGAQNQVFWGFRDIDDLQDRLCCLDRAAELVAARLEPGLSDRPEDFVVLVDSVCGADHGSPGPISTKGTRRNRGRVNAERRETSLPMLSSRSSNARTCWHSRPTGPARSSNPPIDVTAVHTQDALAPAQLRALGYSCVPSL